MMDGRDFPNLAAKWVAGPTEAEWRSAVSRAYYAAFHVARKLLLQCGFAVPRSERAHGYLWLRLSNSGDSDTQLAGARLGSLQGERNRADYDLDHPLPQLDAAFQVQRAREIVRALDAAGQEPNKTQSIAAMKIYERDVLQQVTWHP